MLKRFNDFDVTPSFAKPPVLPKGGYVVKVKDVVTKENRNGEYLAIAVDIVEGPYTGFFAKIYEKQNAGSKKWPCDYLLNVPTDNGTVEDGWAKIRFKTFIESLQASNEGYSFDWDEKKFVGLKFGALFNEREYKKADGSIGRTINLAKAVPADTIRSGNFKIPADKLIAGKNSAPVATAVRTEEITKPKAGIKTSPEIIGFNFDDVEEVELPF